MNGHERQREQSRQMIENAFFELLREKEFSQITVSEIVKRADVARRTFYRLYEKKESVIAVYFQNLCEEYKNGHTQIESYDLKQVARDYFEFWYIQRDKLLTFYRAGLQDLLYYGISSASTEVIRSRIQDEQLRKMPEVEYFATYSVGGFINLLIRWIEKGMEGTPQEYAEVVSSAIIKVISGRKNDERNLL